MTCLFWIGQSVPPFSYLAEKTECGRSKGRSTVSVNFQSPLGPLSTTVHRMSPDRLESAFAKLDRFPLSLVEKHKRRKWKWTQRFPVSRRCGSTLKGEVRSPGDCWSRLATRFILFVLSARGNANSLPDINTSGGFLRARRNGGNANLKPVLARPREWLARREPRVFSAGLYRRPTARRSERARIGQRV